MPDWAQQALLRIKAGEPCALVSVLAIEGSTPREAGVRMLVTPGKTIGSIGGGNLEYQAIAQATLALQQPAGTWRIQDYPLGPLLAQCCGGRVRVMIERLRPEDWLWLDAVKAMDAFALETWLFDDHAERKVITGEIAPMAARGPTPKAGDRFRERIGQLRTAVLMCGAGHVGVAVARLLSPLPFEVNWLDTRAEVSGLDGVTIVPRDQMIKAAAEATGLVLILTHDHQLDYELSVAALKGGAPFVGVIGSGTKRARFLSRLAKDGFEAKSLSRFHCPIGLPGLHGKAPEVIAVSIAAQILLVSQDGAHTPEVERTLAESLQT